MLEASDQDPVMILTNTKAENKNKHKTFPVGCQLVSEHDHQLEKIKNMLKLLLN